jgi:hypothetical protein
VSSGINKAARTELEEAGAATKAGALLGSYPTQRQARSYYACRGCGDERIARLVQALFGRALAPLKIALAPASLKDELLCRSRVFF